MGKIPTDTEQAEQTDNILFLFSALLPCVYIFMCTTNKRAQFEYRCDVFFFPISHRHGLRCRHQRYANILEITILLRSSSSIARAKKK